MSAIDDTFRQLRAAGRKAFMPFVTAGDPDLEFTGAVVREMARHGADLCELGIPYSDPIADGPVIQASYTRALAHHVRLDQILALAGKLKGEVKLPLVTMVSYAVIYRRGLARYVADAQAAGIAGAIVPDLLVEEAGEMSRICRDADFSLIQLVTPTTSRERAVRIAETTTGFIYYVSVTGITGERSQIPPELVENVGWLREQTPLPVCIGFGISQPAHVRLLAPVADGLIVGSAIVRRIGDLSCHPRGEVLRSIGHYVGELAAALNPPKK